MVHRWKRNIDVFQILNCFQDWDHELQGYDIGVCDFIICAHGLLYVQCMYRYAYQHICMYICSEISWCIHIPKRHSCIDRDVQYWLVWGGFKYCDIYVDVRLCVDILEHCGPIAMYF